ncbi:hypothetical protein AB8O64_04795 [Streptomyces sp. QH1-20]|uniref:hypothetical protein n=1 Tax=Streptomyces sp. QH1-20 TaxID=3240934 RepID=UPI0035113577
MEPDIIDRRIIESYGFLVGAFTGEGLISHPSPLLRVSFWPGKQTGAGGRLVLTGGPDELEDILDAGTVAIRGDDQEGRDLEGDRHPGVKGLLTP